MLPIVTDMFIQCRNVRSLAAHVAHMHVARSSSGIRGADRHADGGRVTLGGWAWSGQERGMRANSMLRTEEGFRLGPPQRHAELGALLGSAKQGVRGLSDLSSVPYPPNRCKPAALCRVLLGIAGTARKCRQSITEVI